MGIEKGTEFYILTEGSTGIDPIWRKITWDEFIPVEENDVLIFKTLECITEVDRIKEGNTSN